MMMLEEADGVDVQWEEDASGRKVAVLVVSLHGALDTTVEADPQRGGCDLSGGCTEQEEEDTT
jgi:hypothetical protein